MNITTTRSNKTFLQDWLIVANPELINITNPFWITFPPPSCLQHHVLAFIYAIFLITGSTMNLIVIITVLFSPLRTSKYSMNLSLAASDLMMNVEIPTLIRNSLSCGPVNFTPYECQVFGFIGALSGTVSISCITMISYQRYRKISLPFSSTLRDEDGISSICKALFLVLCCWGHGLLFAVVPLVSETIRYRPDGYLISCSFDYFDHSWINVSYILLFGFSAYVMPLFLITYFYYKIFKEFTISANNMIEMQEITTNNEHQQRPAQRPASAASHSSTGSQRMIDRKMRQEKKLIKSLTRLVACWFIAWTPYAVICVIGLFQPSLIVHPTISMAPALFAKTSFIINPYIYFLSNPLLRREFHRLFGKGSDRTRGKMTYFDASLPRFASLFSGMSVAAAGGGGGTKRHFNQPSQETAV